MKNQIRTFLERLSRGRILKRTIVVKSKSGLRRSVPIYVSPDAQLKYLKPGRNPFDQNLIQIAETFLTELSNVWDVGANVGVFTFAAASVASQGTVLSVEPDIWLAHLLRRSSLIIENQSKDIRILPAAISSQIGVATFLIAQRGRASNALEEVGGRSQMGGTREKQIVPTLTLDSLTDFFPTPNFVKIDVEGAEMMAINGATKIIKSIRPMFYIEICRKHAGAIFSIFQNANYSAFDGETGTPIKACSNNTFFIPNENERLLNAMDGNWIKCKSP